MLAYAYGSVAADCLGPFSDVDIALVFDEQASLDAYQRFNLELDIAARIESACSIRDADVRSLNDAPLRVQGQVLTTGVLLYSRDEDLRVAYEVSVRKRYFDFQPTLEMMREAYFARMRAEVKE
jgi:predicted nucleotidyltransferase